MMCQPSVQIQQFSAGDTANYGPRIAQMQCSRVSATTPGNCSKVSSAGASVGVTKLLSNAGHSGAAACVAETPAYIIPSTTASTFASSKHLSERFPSWDTRSATTASPELLTPSGVHVSVQQLAERATPASAARDVRPSGEGIPAYAYVTSFCVRELVRLQQKRCEDAERFSVEPLQGNLVTRSKHATQYTVSGDNSSAAKNPHFLRAAQNQLFGNLPSNALPYIPLQDEEFFYQHYFPGIVHKLQKVFNSSPSAPAVVVIYFQRLLSASPTLTVAQNVIPILYGLLLTLATKFLDDVQHTNVYYSGCLGLNISVFNRLERHVLHQLNYRLFVQAPAFRPLHEIMIPDSLSQWPNARRG